MDGIREIPAEDLIAQYERLNSEIGKFERVSEDSNVRADLSNMNIVLVIIKSELERRAIENKMKLGRYIAHIKKEPYHGPKGTKLFDSITRSIVKTVEKELKKLI